LKILRWKIYTANHRVHPHQVETRPRETLGGQVRVSDIVRPEGTLLSVFLLGMMALGKQAILQLCPLLISSVNVSIVLQRSTHNPSIFEQRDLFQLFQRDEPALLYNDHPDAARSGGFL